MAPLAAAGFAAEGLTAAVGPARSTVEWPFTFREVKGGEDASVSGRFQAPKDWDVASSSGLQGYTTWTPTTKQVLGVWADLQLLESAFEVLVPSVLEAYPDCEFALSRTSLSAEVVREDVYLLEALVGERAQASSKCVQYVAYLRGLARDGNSLGLLAHAYQVYSFIYSGGIQEVMHHCDSSKLLSELSKAEGESLRLLGSHSARRNKRVARDCRSILESLYLAANTEKQESWDMALDTIPEGLAFMLPITSALAPQQPEK